jgi:hypothetical protein
VALLLHLATHVRGVICRPANGSQIPARAGTVPAVSGVAENVLADCNSTPPNEACHASCVDGALVRQRWGAGRNSPPGRSPRPRAVVSLDGRTDPGGVPGMPPLTF